MTHGSVYQLGAQACLVGLSLGLNPYNVAFSPEAHEAWKDGWLDASRGRRRLRARESEARSHT
jgi:hypothetical protein